jgi:hypothetical protein
MRGTRAFSFASVFFHGKENEDLFSEKRLERLNLSGPSTSGGKLKHKDHLQIS